MKKTVLITGAASGIGRAFADIFAKEGYDLVIAGRNLEKMNRIKEEYELRYYNVVTPIQKDLSKDNAAKELFDEINEKGIRIDVLINNAGVGDYGRFVDIPWQKERDLAGLNMISLMHLMHLYGKDMEQRGGGRILNVSSIAAWEPGPYMPMYYASKAFIFSLSQAAAKEMEGNGVFITCLCPGPTATNFEKEAQMKSGNRMFTWFKPLRAEEVAQEGYNALMKGKVICIPKFRYKAFKFVSRFGSEKLKRDLTCLVNTGKISN